MQNAFCESFMKTLKYEEVHRQEYRDLADARVSIEDFLECVYNQKRIHSALGYCAPAKFEQRLMAKGAQAWNRPCVFSGMAGSIGRCVAYSKA
jgi:transposase InsO family protein